jgi:UDP-N-acetylmuramoyl-tripeptide--D-alanyl-D-alanine ligase
VQTTLQQLTDWLGLDSAAVRQTEKGETTLTGVSTDTRTLAAGNLYIPLIGERFDGHDFIREAVEAGAGAVMCQQDREVPAVDCPVIVVRDTLEALQCLARAYRRHLGIPVIAVTGSNGKTTTKDLTAALLSVKWKVHKTKGNLNNHIGLPLSLLSMEEDTDMAVVEMGMNHAGEIELLSRIATPILPSLRM